jgi:hypothetical protein
MPITIEAKNAIDAAGGEAAIELRLRRFQEDVKYLNSLQQELFKGYLDQWVAVYDKNIVAHSKKLSEVKKQLAQKKVPPNETAIEFIARERKAMIL